MKKIISFILIITITIGIFSPSSLGYEDTKKSTLNEMNIDYDTFKEDSENGSSKIGSSSEKKTYKITEGTKNSVVKALVEVFNVVPTTIRFFLSIIADQGSSDEVNEKYGKGFTIQKLVFNKLNFFEVNFFTNNSNDSNLENSMQKQIAQVYSLVRNIAIVANLAILIYMGIRMALASIALEKAKYKKMLVDWLKSFAIMMLLPYIMIIILFISQTLIEVCEIIMNGLCGNQVIKIEENLLNTATTSTEKGFSLLIPTAIYWILTFYQLKFFWIYAKRLFNTAFLIVISPLVLAQYSIDKINDGQASSFNTWLKEYTMNLMIQPLHALLYTIFMVIASNIMGEAPLLAVVFLATLSRGERVLRNILRIKNTATVQSMNDEMKFKDIAEKVG